MIKGRRAESGQFIGTNNPISYYLFFSGAFQNEILRGVSIQELSGNDSIRTLREMNDRLKFFDLIRFQE